MTDAVSATASAPATKWWLQPGYREQFADVGVEHGQMAPKTWENRPDEGERFKKFLSGLNPLHHIPGVNVVYREITGEEIEPGQRILGGALFGGVFGLISGAVNALVQYATGKDIGGNVMATLKGESAKEAVAVAEPAPKAEPVAAAAPVTEAAPKAVVADASAPLDLDALEAQLSGEAVQPAPQPKSPVEAAANSATTAKETPAPATTTPATTAPAAATPAAAVPVAADMRWFPARGRDNSRGNLNATGPLLSPAMLAQTHRMPTATAAPIAPRVGAGAYDQALELSRELQRHYTGMGLRAPAAN